MGLTIGVDIGGTKILAGVVDAAGVVLDRVKVPTPGEPDAVAEAIGDAVRHLCQDREVEAVGLGAAGFIAADRATVMFSANVSAWVDEPLRDRIQALTGLPVVVENDANAAAWAEVRFGAGVGHDDVVCLTVGTGIGGAIVQDGRLVRGRHGIAGEPGHMRVVPDGLPCGCGNYGCWEQYASGNALTRFARERAAGEPHAAEKLLAFGDGTPEGIRGPHVTQAARLGDPVALAAFTDIGEWLGQGMADLAALLDPSAFVLGGGVSEAGDLLLQPTLAAYQRVLTRGHRPGAEVLVAKLGPEAGLVGAADLARC
ncbi:ROK family glucokinase [Yinghuangia soli]|uniref:Glucokinase n=1 Tax=Yinghuangia soli TaxID=2908204 RepID=A0AA41Q477_9ACTN|nr:ROK family glucokinase [Yinghuangia soli]MCF2531244.1 ROK family glucokinase [Yinghuangia soli]